MKKTRLVLVLVSFALIFSIFPKEVTAQNPPTCEYDPFVEDILAEVTEDDIAQWIRNFSGEDFVPILGVERKILTRFSTQMFNLNVNAMAYPYLGERLLNLGYEEGAYLTDHAYTPSYYPTGAEDSLDLLLADDDLISTERLAKVIGNPDQATLWKNKIVTIPGHGPNADEIVLITAHMDSTSEQRNTYAPGAEDNGSGVAALVEAARLFRFYKFDRTIKIIFFTGEEQGLWGSAAYVSDHPMEMDNIVGVVNLDMFGYDSNDDRCFELHVGTRADSNVVGTCFTDVIDNYDLNLTYDYLTNGATGASDHASFWYANVGAVEVLENFFNSNLPDGCVGQDRNPNYHTTNDRLVNMNLPVTLSIAQAGIGTAASLAKPLGKCFASDPQITASALSDSILLNWEDIEDADVYNVFRSKTTCSGSFTRLGQVSSTSFED
ncbi:MAG: Zn-dependent exopeptidase M28, partial [Chloroflexi bacterium]|nr:Zn-dependent exopeptidase M28 [Chloroflexota bacterium]